MKTTPTLPVLFIAVLLVACTAPGPPPAPPSQAAPTPAAREAQAQTTAPGDEAGIYSAAQAERGRDAFRASCAECHYSSEFRGSQFQFSWRRRSVADLYVEIVRNMPEDAPGTLEDQVYTDIVAYILQLNGFPAGAGELPPDEAVMGRHGLAAPSGPDGTERTP